MRPEQGDQQSGTETGCDRDGDDGASGASSLDQRHEENGSHEQGEPGSQDRDPQTTRRDQSLRGSVRGTQGCQDHEPEAKERPGVRVGVSEDPGYQPGPKQGAGTSDDDATDQGPIDQQRQAVTGTLVAVRVHPAQQR